jgi:hypothetical protein
MFRPHELDYWKSVVTDVLKPDVPIVPYTPGLRQSPSRCLKDHPTAWEGIENILAELIERFHLGTDRCLEFGVEHGFSTVALSSFFRSVTGVDTFQGDIHTAQLADIYSQTVARLAPYDNIHLVRSDFRDYIQTDHSSYDLIHVDIIHTFEATFACGVWSANHSRCTIFHDTESFPAVKQAVKEIARQTGKTFHNFRESNGLGIVI